MEYLFFFSCWGVAIAIFAITGALLENTKLFNKLTELLLNERE